MSLETKEIKAIEAKVKAIHDKNSGKQSKANRRDNILYGLLALLYLVLIVSALIGQAWGAALSTLAIAMWLGMVWFQARYINQLRFVIDTQFDLRKLEQEEIFSIVDKAPTAKKGKK